MQKIDIGIILKSGDEIYAPELGKYFIVVNYNYSDIYTDMVANLKPSDKDINENGFTITLSSMIKLDYYKV